MKVLDGPKRRERRAIAADSELWARIFHGLEMGFGEIWRNTPGLHVTKWPELGRPHLEVTRFFGSTRILVIRIWPVLSAVKVDDQIEIECAASSFLKVIDGALEKSWNDAILMVEEKMGASLARDIAHAYEGSTSAQALVLMNFEATG